MKHDTHEHEDISYALSEVNYPEIGFLVETFMEETGLDNVSEDFADFLLWLELKREEYKPRC